MQESSEHAKIQNRVRELMESSTETFYYIVIDEFNNSRKFSDFHEAQKVFSNFPCKSGGSFELYLTFPEIGIPPIGLSIKDLYDNEIKDAKNRLRDKFYKILFDKFYSNP